ncbi:hypothetical protein SBC1_71000 (plasmid) [Caballeronia sp. SBC1]|uniref:hypothetical protein n=1 Tax=unclassified Caballeronia TaxID=2646786 RepID=UPI0013E12170|nr:MULTISPECIES: hypothetical protein [unclassified Caballeronia]QIE28998.1 hypothetical protein SBC2_70740 [Caballeronia sp. SBC2]QIN67053.1 hypothetical protein SBC1_71000 [Caballeronia sp. SBC1]
MRHTVIGIFDTYDQAEVARSALVASGFARSDIELQAAPQPSSPDDDPALAAGQPPETSGVLANIERFFSMLFGGRDQPPEVAHYSEAVRRGGVLVAVDTATEALADAARQTLAEQGAIDIDERAASWGTLNHGRTTAAAGDDRDHSLLDELGLGTGSAVPGRAPVNPPGDPIGAARADANRARAYPHADRDDPAVQPLDPISPVARDVFAGGSDSTYRATGGDPMTSGTVWQDTNETVRRSASSAASSLDEPLAGGAVTPAPAEGVRPVASEPLSGGASAQGWRAVDPLDPLDETETASRVGSVGGTDAMSATGSPVPGTLSQTGDSSLGTRPGARSTMPDEYMEYEDEFRSDYESKYAATGASYEEYEEAYKYGASAASDERFHRRNWDDTMETELRHDWEGRGLGGAPTWERFKLAVRHGWERVTGHHHL